MKVVSTTDIPLFQSMVLNQKEEEKEAAEKKNVPLFSHSFSLCCVFLLWKTDSESERETEKKIVLEWAGFLWKPPDFVSLLSPSLMGMCRESFCCCVLLLFSFNLNIWDKANRREDSQGQRGGLFRSELDLKRRRCIFKILEGQWASQLFIVTLCVHGLVGLFGFTRCPSVRYGQAQVTVTFSFGAYSFSKHA